MEHIPLKTATDGEYLSGIGRLFGIGPLLAFGLFKMLLALSKQRLELINRHGFTKQITLVILTTFIK